MTKIGFFQGLGFDFDFWSFKGLNVDFFNDEIGCLQGQNLDFLYIF